LRGLPLVFEGRASHGDLLLAQRDRLGMSFRDANAAQVDLLFEDEPPLNDDDLLDDGHDCCVTLHSDGRHCVDDPIYCNPVDESPVLLGALGLAAGALLGALLPQTDQKEAALGGIASQARDAATNLAQGAMESGKQVGRPPLIQVATAFKRRA
jgi:hypothetical protein